MIQALNRALNPLTVGKAATLHGLDKASSFLIYYLAANLFATNPVVTVLAGLAVESTVLYLGLKYLAHLQPPVVSDDCQDCEDCQDC